MILAWMAAACCQAAAADRMDLGTNFWNLGWHRPDDCFRDVRAVSGPDPWNPRFLQDIAAFRTLRFMDWDGTNGSARERWTERPRRDAPSQNPAAYEWMIDLCNRSGADLWLTVPHRSVTRTAGDRPSDYALRLCLLVKTGVDMGAVDLGPLEAGLARMTPEELVAAGGVRSGAPLAPGLRLWIEYSNETWNGAFKQSHACCDEGEALGLDEKRWTAGFRYHAWAAIRVFRAADLVYGPGSPRVVRALATQSANSWIAGRHLEVMRDPKRNPWGVKADAIAAAPYFGHDVDGGDPDAVEKLRASIRKAGEQSAKHRKIADEAGLRLVAYEGGQHVTKRAAALNRSPEMGVLYREYLEEMSKHYDHFVHYCHVGRAGDGGAWGALERSGQPPEEAPKHRALLDWAKSCPPRKRD